MKSRTLLITLIFMFCLTAPMLFGQKLPITVQSDEAKAAFENAYSLFLNLQFQQVGPETQRALDIEPNFPMALMMLAVTQPAPQGEETLKKALAQKATDEEKLYLKATLHSYKQENEQAVELLKKLVKKTPDDERVLTFLAAIQQRLGNFDSALKYYEKADKIAPDLPYTLVNLATIKLLQDDYAAARADYKKVIKKNDPDATPFQPFFGVAWSHLYEGHPDKAITVIEEFLDRYNRNGSAQGFPPVWIWNQMGRIHLESGKTKEAMRCYEVGYKSVPPSQLDSTQKAIWEGRQYHGKARVLAKMGEHDKAWAIAEKVKAMIEGGGEQAEQFWKPYYYLAGYIKLEAGEYDKAVKYLEKADETDTFHTCLLGRAYYKAGDMKKAAATYQKVADNSNSNVERALSYPEAQRMLAKLGTN